jgi:predicted negative regulator of RcsB-dependent stress response
LILDGPASIESQGCADPPLLAVASDDTTPLAFVHVVKQEVEKIQSAAESIDSSTKDLTETSEEEFQSDTEESRGGMQIGEESSDEEFEF